MRLKLFFVVSFLLGVLLPAADSTSSEKISTAPGRFVGREYFGGHFFYTAADIRWPGETSTRLPEVVGSWRLWDAYGTEWRYLEPEKGVWRFEYLDRYVKQAEARGMKVMLTLGQTPRWASSRPDEETATGFGNAAMPSDIADWKSYIRTVSQRYKGRIQAYEIWNEPAFSDTDPAPSSIRKAGYFYGSAADMELLTKEAASVIRGVDSDALVVSSSVVGHHQGVRRLDALLKAGVAQHVDVIGFHFYFVDTTAPEELPRLSARVRETMRKYGADGLPLWNTESGLVIQSPGKLVKALEPGGKGVLSKVLSEDEAVDSLSRLILLGLHSGLQRYYWFAWDSYSMGFLSSNKPRSQTLPGFAFGKLARWTVGSYFEGCSRTGDSVWRCQFRYGEGGRKAEISWSENGSGQYVCPFEIACYVEELVSNSSATEPLRFISVKHRPILVKNSSAPWAPGEY